MGVAFVVGEERGEARVASETREARERLVKLGRVGYPTGGGGGSNGRGGGGLRKGRGEKG